ncbi:MAG: hypothetical protein CMJ81_12245 [Planctomycetaceae bacterium]|nr:hypothetical protein [Planctomycetaceae bacterium]
MSFDFCCISKRSGPILASVFVVVFCTSTCLQADPKDIDSLLEIVAQAGPQGANSSSVRAASEELTQHGVEILPQLLTAMDVPNIVAANWYRTVYEQIISREFQKSQPEFPVLLLQQITRDSRWQGRTRRLVVRLVEKLAPGYHRSILPTLLDDPEFRSEAVDFVMDRGDKALENGNAQSAKAEFQTALQHAREAGQVTGAADRLKALGVEIDIVTRMGIVTRWYLVGPFDAPGKSGFDRSFSPEQSVDLAASYVGVDGAEIEWNLFATQDRLGQVNLVQAIAPATEAVGYAYAELDSPHEQEVQLRCSADDNLSVWLNGQKILARRQWLNGSRLDRFAAPATFQKGRNRVLVKICQGPQHQNPAVANHWSMQLRFCDETGAGANFESALPVLTE